ncbi:CpaE family protein [Vibrio splendidus]|uniref:AAA family ATPase n=1 Tax=Vibrio splendidus TaxID=29497 RepID=UPI0021B331F4|nr:chromosome partitioning protein ParA [Vibrio splendidus]UWZ99138.1 chromosome partitioning protein ParA [Vibrio splendidus]
MFDLVKNIKDTTPQVVELTNGPAGCALIYQSKECSDLVKEMFQFEGWNEPHCIKREALSPKFYSEQTDNIVILDLTESQDILVDAQDIASKLPTRKGVIVIGGQDSISTLRDLKEMGFYYLLWPINKLEFSDFVMNVHKNLETYTGVSKKRKAKRVAVVGSKGGIGTSFITTELGSKLSSQNIDTILVDHQYSDSNIDVLMGLEDFRSKAIDEFAAPIHELDTEGALSYLTKVRKSFRLLSLQGDSKQDKIFNYNQMLCELMSRNTNFIIEDFSGSIDFRVDPQLLVETYDVVVVVFEPSVSSIRNAKSLLEALDQKQISIGKRIRVVTFANHHRPESTFVIEQSDLDKYLGAKVDLNMVYCKKLSHLLIEGKRAHKHERSVNNAIEELTSLINGQSSGKPHGWLSRLVGR